MATRDQERARLAFEHVTAVRTWDESRKKKYASIVYAAPALLRSAGLSQALHFILSRRKNKADDGPKVFLDQLAAQLGRVDKKIVSSDALLARVRTAELADYLRLTQEALACVTWYRRFVQGVLEIEPGATDVRSE